MSVRPGFEHYNDRLINLATLAGDATFPLAKLVTDKYREMLSADLFAVMAERDQQSTVISQAAARIEEQIPATRGYLIQNGIDAHFADVLLSHYADFARDLRDALSQASGEAA